MDWKEKQKLQQWREEANVEEGELCLDRLEVIASERDHWQRELARCRKELAKCQEVIEQSRKAAESDAAWHDLATLRRAYLTLMHVDDRLAQDLKQCQQKLAAAEARERRLKVNLEHEAAVMRRFAATPRICFREWQAFLNTAAVNLESVEVPEETAALNTALEQAREEGAAHVAKAREWVEQAQGKLNRAIPADRQALKMLNEARAELNLAEGKEPYDGLDGFTSSPRAESVGADEI